MIYALWYRFKGVGSPWLATDFLSTRTRGQFIARHKKALDEWAIEDQDRPAFPAGQMLDGPPPKHLKVTRNP